MTTRSPYRWALAAGALSVVVAIVIGSLVHTHPAVWDRLILAQLLAARTDVTTSTLVSITTLFNPLGSVLLALALAVGIWAVTRDLRCAGFILAAPIVASAITHTLKYLYHRERPPELDHLVTAVDYSFPSGHTTAAASLALGTALVVAAYWRSWPGRVLVVALALALAVTVAVSRLYLGVHWFTDTLAGGLIGCGGTLLMSFLLVGAHQRREARQRMNARAGSSNSAATSARKREPSSPSTSR